MRIGLIGMSAKPYHAGHHAIVEKAADENEEVKLFVSLTDRARKGEVPIRGSDMLRVWEEHLIPIMPQNVTVELGSSPSPVQKIYQVLAQAEEVGSEDTFTVYSDPTDTAVCYPDENRIKYFPTLYSKGRPEVARRLGLDVAAAERQVVFACETSPGSLTRGVGTPDVSGTSMRAALASGDRDAFRAGMPRGVDSDAVFDILRSHHVTESVLRAFIRSVL